MTIEDFNNYRFSAKTQINYFEDHWDTITEVDWERGWVGTTRGQIVESQDIKGIREAL